MCEVPHGGSTLGVEADYAVQHTTMDDFPYGSTDTTTVWTYRVMIPRRSDDAPEFSGTLIDFVFAKPQGHWFYGLFGP